MNSTQGKLIQCVYKIKIKAIVNDDYLCIRTQPSITCVIKIIPNEPIMHSAPEPPPYWNPSVLEPSIVLEESVD